MQDIHECCIDVEKRAEKRKLSGEFSGQRVVEQQFADTASEQKEGAQKEQPEQKAALKTGVDGAGYFFALMECVRLGDGGQEQGSERGGDRGGEHDQGKRHAGQRSVDGKRLCAAAAETAEHLRQQGRLDPLQNTDQHAVQTERQRDRHGPAQGGASGTDTSL